MKQRKQNKLLALLPVIVGNLLYALSVKSFLLPADLISCGTTGLGLIMERLCGLPLTVFIFLFNMAMLAVGWVILGRKFAMTTALSSVLYPIFLELLNRVLGDYVITENLLLNAIFAGIGLGGSLGIVIRAGASTGGMDIPPLVLNKFFRIPVSASLWIFDFLIMAGQMFFHTGEDLLYGVILLVAISTTLNKVMLLGTTKTQVKIISDHSDEIRSAILARVDRGVTLLHGEGGYRRNATEVILTIVSNHELPKIQRVAREIDPDCFMIINQVSEVWGRGFSANKHYAEAEKKQ
ncbi:MAG: YitT family protein [Oscillospiraceae bacterium]|nr:YitT family protein [Oscillospiraceae bacterium]MBQ9148224.1 YitT family protein [Oscillospiraceae bacterium]